MPTETTVPIDDTGMLADIMTDAPQEPTSEPAVETQPETDGPARDELGRFAVKDAEPEKVPEQPVEAKPTELTEQPKDDGGQVPSWRLRELREAREAAERRAEETGRREYALQQQLQDMARQLAELRKPKEEPVDIFQNPDGYMDQRLTPIEQRLQDAVDRISYRASLAENIATHGAQAVKEMREGLVAARREGNPELEQLNLRMSQSDDPVGVAMQWFQSHKLVKETGGDLSAYKQKVLDEAMKDPAFQAKVIEATRGQVQQNSRPNIQLPPSLSKVPGSAPDHSSDDSDMSDAGIFRNAMR